MHEPQTEDVDYITQKICKIKTKDTTHQYLCPTHQIGCINVCVGNTLNMLCIHHYLKILRNLAGSDTDFDMPVHVLRLTLRNWSQRWHFLVLANNSFCFKLFLFTHSLAREHGILRVRATDVSVQNVPSSGLYRPKQMWTAANTTEVERSWSFSFSGISHIETRI